MKALMLSLLICISFSVFAGPEERLNLTCFKTDDSVPNLVRQNYCLELISIDLKAGLVKTEGYATSTPSELILTKYMKDTEDGYLFVAKKLINKAWDENCGEGNYLEIEISGKVQSDGEVLKDSLTLQVNLKSTNNTCQSPAVLKNISYDRFHY